MLIARADGGSPADNSTDDNPDVQLGVVVRASGRYHVILSPEMGYRISDEMTSVTESLIRPA